MFSLHDRLVATIFAVALCASLGCSESNYTPARASDPAIARQTLATALDAWKSGESTQVLANQKPQLFVGDEDWKAGCALKSYEFLGDGESFGNSVRFQIGLKLTEKSGSVFQKSVRYVVATNPVGSVQRDDRID